MSLACTWSIDEHLIREIRKAATFAKRVDVSLDVKGVVWLEHINIVVGNRDMAEIFYFQGLGLTRDPAKDVGRTMWANIGNQQLHLVDAMAAEEDSEEGKTFNGYIGLALPDLVALRKRLASVKEALKTTQFEVVEQPDFVVVRCPWGNLFCIFSSNTASKDSESETPRPLKVRRTKMADAHAVDQGMAVRGQPGIRFLHVACSHARKVGSFYKELFDCCVYPGGDNYCAVCVGPSVHLILDSRNHHVDMTADRILQGRGIHICVYICEFKKVYEALQKKGLIWTNPRFASLDTCDSFEEAAAGRQFRFRSVCDLDTGDELLELEHEMRSIRHLQYMKDLYYVSK